MAFPSAVACAGSRPPTLRQRSRHGATPDDRDEDDVDALENREMNRLSGRVAQVGHHGECELAEPAWLLDSLSELEEAHAQIELVAVAVEEALLDEVGRDPRDRRLRQVRASGQLRDTEPFVVFPEGLEDGRHPIEHADRFGPVRCAHVGYAAVSRRVTVVPAARTSGATRSGSMAPLGPAIEMAPSTTWSAESTGLATARIPGYETSQVHRHHRSAHVAQLVPEVRRPHRR